MIAMIIIICEVFYYYKYCKIACIVQWFFYYTHAGQWMWEYVLVLLVLLPIAAFIAVVCWCVRKYYKKKSSEKLKEQDVQSTDQVAEGTTL